jgi:type IV secretion system protein TrbJ
MTMNRILRTTAIGLALAVAAFTVPAQAGMAVFDASNYAQNLLTAVRTLEQINNQIRSLQNEAKMLENMGRNLQPLGYSSQERLESALQQINDLMQQAHGLSYEVEATQNQFARLYPREYTNTISNDQLARDARERWASSLDALRHTMAVQSQIVSNVQADSATLSRLLQENQAAAGSLQAQQAGNQLIALAAKQNMQLQELLATQARVQAMEQARSAADEEAARLAFQRFLGNRTAYPAAQ